MTAAEIDEVTELARLMRAVYPGRSEAYCIERAGAAIADVAVAVDELGASAYMHGALESFGRARSVRANSLRLRLDTIVLRHIEAIRG